MGSFNSGASVAKFLMFAYNISPAQAQAIAPGYVHVFGCHTNNVAAFRAGNPTMDLGIYIPLTRDDGVYGVDDVPRPLSYFVDNDPSWIAYTSDKATPAYQFGGSATPLDQSNSAVQAYQLNSYAVPASASGAYSAVSVDNVTLTNDWSFYGVYSEATPGSQYSGSWNPLYTGVNTQPLYAQNIIKWLQSFGPQVRALNPALKMIGNFDPGTYGFSAAQTASVLAAHDGLIAEFGFTDYGSVNQSGATWLAIVQWMQTVQALGKSIYVVNQLPYPTAQSDIDFAFASYLCGKYGSAALYLCPQSSPGNPEYGSEHLYPHYSLQLGAAIGDMALTQGVYVRRFTYGRALVNASATATATYLLPSGWAYTDVYGNSYKSSITLAPLTGVTLLNQGDFMTNDGLIPTDIRGFPALGVWSDTLNQMIPVHIGALVTGADNNLYAKLDVTASIDPAVIQRVDAQAGDFVAGSIVDLATVAGAIAAAKMQAQVVDSGGINKLGIDVNGAASFQDAIRALTVAGKCFGAYFQTITSVAHTVALGLFSPAANSKNVLIYRLRFSGANGTPADMTKAATDFAFGTAVTPYNKDFASLAPSSLTLSASAAATVSGTFFDKMTIPGAPFEVLQNNSYIFLPAGNAEAVAANLVQAAAGYASILMEWAEY